MEELIEKIDELIIAIKSNSIPLWLSIVGILIPIFISIVVAIQAYIQHNSNKKLQIYISEKETRVQMHSDFLSIYDAFCAAHSTIFMKEKQVVELLAIPNLTSQWYTDIKQALAGVCQACNRVNLLLPNDDTDLSKILKSVFDNYRDLSYEIKDYIIKGNVEHDRGQAWGKLNPYYGIQYGDYITLNNNSEAYNDFISLFDNDTTMLIKQKIKKLLSLFEYEKFDKFFEPYLRITSNMKENKK